MKQLLILSLTVAAFADEPVKLKDADALAVRNIQLAATEAQTRAIQAEQSYRQAQESLTKASADMKALIGRFLKDYKCDGCTLNAQELQLNRPPKAEAQGEKKEVAQKK